LRKYIKWKSDRRRSIFATLIVSYIVILLLPIGIGSVFYTKVEDIMIRNAYRSNEAMLDQVRRTVDSRLIEIDQLTTQIALNPKLGWLLDQRPGEPSWNFYTFFEFMQEMARYKTISTFIEDFYVYFDQSDAVLSTSLKTDSKTFYENIYHYQNLSYTDYKHRLLTTYHYKEFLPSEEMLVNDRLTDMISFVHSLPIGEKQEIQGSIVVLIKESTIQDMLAAIHGTQDGAVYILNKNSEKLLAPSDCRA
jgi:two-component system response regulator YesN